MGFVSNFIRNLPDIFWGRQPTKPLLFSYYITHRCNLNCFYCCDGEGKRFKENPINELSTGEVRKLLGILRQETDTLDITGGEPLLRTDLEEILEFAKGIGFRTVLNTKGVGLEKRPHILSLTDVLVLSIDTMNPAKLGKILGRPVETAEMVFSALEFAVKSRKESLPLVVLSVVAAPGNLKDAEDVLEFAVNNGLGFQISPEIVGVNVNEKLLNNTEYIKLLKKVGKYKYRGFGILGVKEYLNGIRDFGTFPCHPLLMPVIRPDGAMYYPCLESKNAEINLLHESDYRSALENIRRRRGEIPDCSSCCHIFCHMAISLLQRHPISAMKELKTWRGLNA